MSRGSIAVHGSVTVAKNGYTYIKQDGRGWVLKHWLIWEEKSGRQVNPQLDMIRFKDGDRNNFDPDNIIRIEKNQQQLRKKIAQLYANKAEIEAQLSYYEELLARTQDAKESAITASDS